MNKIKWLMKLNASFFIDDHAHGDHISGMFGHVAHLTQNQKREGSMNIARALRLTASFALLGAVLTGMLAGWTGHDLPFDPRWIGAGVGAVASIFAQIAHLV